MLTPGQAVPTDAKSSLRSMAEDVTTSRVLNSGALATAVSITSAPVAKSSEAGSGVNDANQGRAFSTGQIVGIVLGVIMAIALAIGLLWWVRGDDYMPVEHG